MKIIKQIQLVGLMVLIHTTIRANGTAAPVRDSIIPIQALVKMEGAYHVPNSNGDLQFAYNNFWYVLRDFENGVVVDSVVQFGTLSVYGEKYLRAVIGTLITDTLEAQVQDDLYNITVNYRDSNIIIRPVDYLYKRIFEVDLFDTSLNLRQIDTVTVIPFTGPEPNCVDIKWDFKPESPFTYYQVTYDTALNQMRYVAYRMRKEVMEPGSGPVNPDSFVQVHYGHNLIYLVNNYFPDIFRTNRYIRRQEGQFVVTPAFEGFEIINLLEQ